MSEEIAETSQEVVESPQERAESPEFQWTDEALKSDVVSKRELLVFIQEQAAPRFLKEHKLKGTLKNVLKVSKKDKLMKAYYEMYEKNAFKGSEYDVEDEVELIADKVEEVKIEKKEVVKEEEGPPKFKKFILKKGDKINFPKKGDMVSCYYIGKLEDGTVFDQLQPGTKKKRNQPIKFKVGKGNVIRGWDEGIMTMSVGEKCELKIESDWAYGKQGKPPKIPKNANLNFEVELVRID